MELLIQKNRPHVSGFRLVRCRKGKSMEQNGRGKESGTIGSRIRNLRNRDGMSQEQLALLLHFENKGTISSYETDRRTVPSDVVIRLAEIFQTTTDYLLCGKYPERNIREVDPEMQEMMEVMLSLQSDAARKAALLQIRALADMERNLLP